MTTTAIATIAAFSSAGAIERGENLFLMGGPGTGKLTAALDIARAAEARGLTTAAIVQCDQSWPFDALLEPRAHAFTGWERNPRNIAPAYLESDLLVVGDAATWLEAAPITMLVLLTMRAEKGKATILVASEYEWRAMLNEQRFSRALEGNDFNEVGLLADVEGSDAVSFVRRSYGALMARREMLASLGLDVIMTQPESMRLASTRPSRFGAAYKWSVARTGNE